MKKITLHVKTLFTASHTQTPNVGMRGICLISLCAPYLRCNRPALCHTLIRPRAKIPMGEEHRSIV